MTKILVTIGAALSVAVAVAAQGGMQPTCKGCPASYIANDEIQAYVKRALATGAIDQQVRSIDIGK